MKRIMLLSITGAVFLCAASIAGTAQETSKPALKGYFTVKPHSNPDHSKVLEQAIAGTGLPMWSYSTTSNRDGNHYSGEMVGASPYTSNATTTITAQIIPVVFKIGTTVFDPTKADHTCEGGKVPLTLYKQSPILTAADFTLNGVDVGKGQYVDDFQRANFWGAVNGNGGKYHTTLKPVTLAKITVNPGSNGAIVYPYGCEVLGGVDVNWWDSYVTGTLIPSLASKGVGPTTFPIFVMYNVVMYEGNPDNCCILGYHGAYGSPVQTYSPLEFDSTGAFGPGFTDTYVSGHEVAEWMNDPLGTNPTPAWGNIGQVSQCQNNLEVGDPLTGTNAVTKLMPNGFTYHMQELAFFSWFYDSTSSSAGGLFSDNGTFISDAGPVCH
jgi:hypothetical protein